MVDSTCAHERRRLDLVWPALLPAVMLLALVPVACAGAAASATANTQLPPEIMVDRHLVRVERLLAADDPVAALETMNEILTLQDEHDVVLEDGFRFQYAQVAFAAGRTESAIASLNEYLLATGREGEFYREALELLDSAEVRLERAEVERTRLTRWPPGHVFRDCEVCPKMVVLPGSTLALGRYEVTVGEYRAFASASGGGADACRDGDSWRDPGFPQTDRHPVTCVSWNDAQAYVSWLSIATGATYRLPTEAEWERAAAGSQPGCYRDRTGRAGSCPVGTYGVNATGFADMVGNLVEWTDNCWQGDCDRRVVRGGSWITVERLQRYGDPTGFRGSGLGIRVARALE